MWTEKTNHTKPLLLAVLFFVPFILFVMAKHVYTTNPKWQFFLVLILWFINCIFEQQQQQQKVFYIKVKSVSGKRNESYHVECELFIVISFIFEFTRISLHLGKVCGSVRIVTMGFVQCAPLASRALQYINSFGKNVVSDCLLRRI